MEIDPAVLIGFITVILGLLGFAVRALMSGDIHPHNTVPRSDYEAQVAINTNTPVAIHRVADAVEKLAATVLAQHVANGNGKKKEDQ